MRWLVGLDLLDYSKGAVRFAAWLHRNAGAERFTGIHVLEAQPRRLGRADQTEDELRAWVLELAAKAVDELGVGEHLDGVSVVEADDADEGLERALEIKGGSALIVGRRARIGEDPFIRLGAVARRLVRRLPAPLAVVPPDLDDDLPEGPIVLATDLGPSSEPALLFARELAAAVGREILVVYAVAVHGAFEAYVSATSWDRAHLEAAESAQAALTAWLERHRLSARSIVVQGPAGQAILGVAEREGAAMIIAGSRRLSLVDRIFSSSVGAELAALAPMPVIIVPPEPPLES
ncbi:MAG: universal stress protein [Myxococcales bacterium]|nr:universal stress protein [Myxococcales bacterium]